MMRKGPDYKALGVDPEIIGLCRAVNEFPSIRTDESCQGFVNDHRPGVPWAVYYRPHPSPPTRTGYKSIEFITYACGSEASAAGFDVRHRMNAPPPLLNGPGTCLYFIIEGIKRHPNEFAAFLRKMRKLYHA